MRTMELPPAEIRIFPEASLVCRAAVDEIVRLAASAIDQRGRFVMALAGGSTPRNVYSLLAEDHKAGLHLLSWDKVHVFFGDERPVPPDHPESNFRMAHETLLAHVPIPAGNIHRVEAERDPADAAAAYAAVIQTVFAVRPGEWPAFDLILLGMGPDGHTASLFPGSPALQERTLPVCANWVEKLKCHRITFTFPLINAAGEILFVAGGTDKAAMLRNILRGDPSGQTYPAQRVHPEPGRLLWMVDEGAARDL